MDRIGDGTQLYQSAEILTADGQKGQSLYRWYVLFVMTASYTFYNLDKMIVAVVLEPIRSEFHMTDSQMGMLVGFAVTVPLALTCIPLGILADRVNRVRLLATLIAGWSVMTALSGLCRTPEQLMVARMGVGLFEGGFSSAALSLLTDSFPRRQRSTALGLFQIGPPLGVLLGLIGGAMIAQHHGWRSAFFIAGLPGLACAVLLALSVREPGRDDNSVDGSIEAKQFRAAVRALTTNAALRNLSIGMCLCMLMQSSISMWLPTVFTRIYGMSLQQSGLIAGLILGFFAAAGAAMAGFLADRVGAEREGHRLTIVIVAVAIGIALTLLGLLVVPTMTLALATLALAVFFGYSFIGVCWAQCATMAPPELRSTIFAILFVIFNIMAVGVGSQLVGILSDLYQPRFGAHALSMAIGSMTMFGAIGVVCLIRSRSILLRQS